MDMISASSGSNIEEVDADPNYYPKDGFIKEILLGMT